MTSVNASNQNKAPKYETATPPIPRGDAAPLPKFVPARDARQAEQPDDVAAMGLADGKPLGLFERRPGTEEEGEPFGDVTGLTSAADVLAPPLVADALFRNTVVFFEKSKEPVRPAQ